MSTMKHWLEKTPEMIAMDRYFSGDLQTLASRYNAAIENINTSGGVPSHSHVLDTEMAAAAQQAYLHFGSDWLNPTNPSSGGNYWPHIPSFAILIWIKQGVLNAMRKGLGWSQLVARQAVSNDPNDDPSTVFVTEIHEAGLTQADLDPTLPVVTAWVCTSPPGQGTIEVDAIRGPSVVELVISTPWPKTITSRLFSTVEPLIDAQWTALHNALEAGEGNSS